MASKFKVGLNRLIKDFKLEAIYLPQDSAQIEISNPEVNRPGLQLAGFYDYFDNDRIQIIGKAEVAYLESPPKERLMAQLDAFFALQPVTVIISRSMEVMEEMVICAHKYRVPLLRTAEATSQFLSGLISSLNVELAPRITRHGVLVEVYGEGILLLGESGVGKSETAMELIKRGHRLIADDAVEIRRVSNRTLVGTSPENIRHFMELRGIGIINARMLFGMGSVKVTEKIDMVIQLELWDQNKAYDRMGIDNNYIEILGNKISALTIPVKPGRNLAIIIEVAAMNNRQKKMGYNAAQELLHNLGMLDPTDGETPQIDHWNY